MAHERSRWTQPHRSPGDPGHCEPPRWRYWSRGAATLRWPPPRRRPESNAGPPSRKPNARRICRRIFSPPSVGSRAGDEIPQSGRWTPWPWTIDVEGQGSFLPNKAAAIAAVQALQARGIQSIDVGCVQINRFFRIGVLEGRCHEDPLFGSEGRGGGGHQGRRAIARVQPALRSGHSARVGHVRGRLPATG